MLIDCVSILLLLDNHIFMTHNQTEDPNVQKSPKMTFYYSSNAFFFYCGKRKEIYVTNCMLKFSASSPQKKEIYVEFGGISLQTERDSPKLRRKRLTQLESAPATHASRFFFCRCFKFWWKTQFRDTFLGLTRPESVIYSSRSRFGLPLPCLCFRHLPNLVLPR